jgi:hypothetical protein
MPDWRDRNASADAKAAFSAGKEKAPQVALRGQAVSFRRRKMIQKESSTPVPILGHSLPFQVHIPMTREG